MYSLSPLSLYGPYFLRSVLVKYNRLKEQCHKIFDFKFSTWISFLQAPDYTVRAVSNFFENSLRSVSLTPVANLPPVSTKLAKLVSKFATDVVDTGGKFATGVVDTGGASRDTVPLM